MIDLSSLRDICNRYKGCATEYYVEPIPERKEKNARESIIIPVAEQIVALIDFTVFGSASDAMVVTETGIHWKSGIDTTPKSLTWNQLQQRPHSESPFLFSKLIDFGDDLKMHLSGAATLSKSENHAVSDLLNDLRSMAAGSASDVETGIDDEDLDIGLVECEFCMSMLKPEVTYCKHCGIKLRG